MAIRTKVTRLLSSLSTDLEKGLQQAHNTEIANSPLPVLDRDAQIQASLDDFRFAVGIHNSVDMNNGRPIPNVGIYQRVCKTESMYKKQFKTFSWMINLALGLQIVFAAALTALGAGNGPRSAVTAFGALNTILAGFLTYLKGSGLPNRYKYFKDEVTKVREYIEQRERELSRGDPRINLREEIAIIEQMYESMKRDIEVNTPEAYVSRTKEQAHPQQLDVGRYTNGARRELDDRMYNMDEKVGYGRQGIEDRVQQTRAEAESGLRGVTSGLNDRLSNVRQGLASHLSKGRLDAEARLHDTRTDLGHRYDRTRDDFDDRYNTTRHDIDDTMTRTRRDVDDRVETARHDLDERYQNTRHDLDDRVTRERMGLETRLTDTRTDVEAQFAATRSGVESQVDAARIATAAQVENTRHGLETRIDDTRAGITAQVEDSRHGMEARMKEVQAQVKEQEDKIMGIAEKVASKVLAVTQRRHEDDHKPQ